jgi:hypothetical protein
MKPQGFVPPSAEPSAHEASDLHIGNILRVAGVLGITLVVSILVLILFFRHMEKTYPARTSEASPEVPASDLPPAPRLQMHPLSDLRAVRAVEDSHLNHYGWIDRGREVAQIPVDRAMVLWVQGYSSISAPPPPMAPPATNAASASGPTELQMRQQKAQGGANAP